MLMPGNRGASQTIENCTELPGCLQDKICQHVEHMLPVSLATVLRTHECEVIVVNIGVILPQLPVWIPEQSEIHTAGIIHELPLLFPFGYGGIGQDKAALNLLPI